MGGPRRPPRPMAVGCGGRRGPPRTPWAMAAAEGRGSRSGPQGELGHLGGLARAGWEAGGRLNWRWGAGSVGGWGYWGVWGGGALEGWGGGAGVWGAALLARWVGAGLGLGPGQVLVHQWSADLSYPQGGWGVAAALVVGLVRRQ